MSAPDREAVSEYPEHDKLRLISTESQIIGSFLEFSGYTLAEWQKVRGFRDEQLLPVHKSIEKILAEYFDIDLQRLDDEKRAMLAALRQEATPEAQA